MKKIVMLDPDDEITVLEHGREKLSIKVKVMYKMLTGNQWKDDKYYTVIINEPGARP